MSIKFVKFLCLKLCKFVRLYFCFFLVYRFRNLADVYISDMSMTADSQT